MSGSAYRALYKRRRDAGQCVSCAVPCTGARCPACLVKWRAYKSAYAARCLARGECHKCGYQLARCECRKVSHA